MTALSTAELLVAALALAGLAGLGWWLQRRAMNQAKRHRVRERVGDAGTMTNVRALRTWVLVLSVPPLALVYALARFGVVAALAIVGAVGLVVLAQRRPARFAPVVRSRPVSWLPARARATPQRFASLDAAVVIPLAMLWGAATQRNDLFAKGSQWGELEAGAIGLMLTIPPLFLISDRGRWIKVLARDESLPAMVRRWLGWLARWM
jgi:hypothetical protein